MSELASDHAVDGGIRIEAAVRDSHGVAICGYLMAGYPTMDAFGELLVEVSAVADLVEVGIPFSDPMADGQTIQHASHTALVNGVTFEMILATLEDLGPGLRSPILLMGYFNPFLAYGLERLATRASAIGVSGLIVPDLPLEESGELEGLLSARGQALIRLVTPATPDDRLKRIGEGAQGFVYAVTTTGITGGDLTIPPELIGHLERLRRATSRPVLAGFGVRRPQQVQALAPYVDGVVVGTALIDAIDRGESPVDLLEGLRNRSVSV